MDEQLKKLIQQYLDADTPKKWAATKSAITNKINKMAEDWGVREARNRVMNLITKYSEYSRPELSFLIQRMNPVETLHVTSLQGDRIFGWWGDKLSK